jgi:mRNA interferase MazF
MARELTRGEVWSYEFKAPDKARPVVILSRADAIAVLHTVIVAPITSTIRGLPSEVLVGPDEGLKTESVVNLDHVQTVEKTRLRRHLGSLGPAALRRVCTALSIAVGCDE